MARYEISRGIGIIDVRAKPGHKTRGLLVAGNLVLECALGKGGISAFKREGDGATPLATMRLLYGYRRGDKGVLPSSRLPLGRVRRLDGWCDAPSDANYNRPVRLPYAASHEDMWRRDDLYDVCIVMDWNIAPRRRGCGSAIFFSPCPTRLYAHRRLHSIEARRHGAPPASSDGPNHDPCPEIIVSVCGGSSDDP